MDNPDYGPDLTQTLRDLRELQARMNDSERVELWENLREGYCEHCGTIYLPCFCHPCYDV